MRQFFSTKEGLIRDQAWLDHLDNEREAMGDIASDVYGLLGPVGTALQALRFQEVSSMKSFATLCQKAISEKDGVVRLWSVNGTLALFRVLPDHTYRPSAEQPLAVYMGSTRIFGDGAFVNRSAVSLKFFLHEALGMKIYS